jgi:hypothetical protein
VIQEKQQRESSMSATLPHFLAFLPDKKSPNREKTFRSSSTNKKKLMNDVIAAFASEMFDTTYSPRS